MPRAKKDPSIGSLIDEIYQMREEIRIEQKAVDNKKIVMEEKKLELIKALRSQNVEGSKGKTATATITTERVPVVEDWERFYNWMYKNKAAHLMFRRLTSTAYREMLESRKGRLIPGVKNFDKETVSLLKRTK